MDDNKRRDTAMTRAGWKDNSGEENYTEPGPIPPASPIQNSKFKIQNFF
jgi:hypothetical protein